MIKITASLICAASILMATPALAGGGSRVIVKSTTVARSHSSSYAYAQGGNASIRESNRIQPGGAPAPSFGGGNCAVGFGITLPYIGGGFSSQTLQDDCQIINAGAVLGGMGYRSTAKYLIMNTEIVERLQRRVASRKANRGRGRALASNNGCRIPSKSNPAVCLD